MSKKIIRLIAEIGINHKGSFENAKTLIEQAATSGCWAVKFQYRDIDSFYKSYSEIGDEILFEEIKRTNLTIQQLCDLAIFANSLGLKSGVSFFRSQDFDSIGNGANYFDFYKVPSAECTNHLLINKLLETGKKVMVSTGGHSLSDIKKSLLQFKDKNLIIFHCVANYPTKLGAQNLRFIEKLKSIGFKDVGYSSHDEDFETSLIAMSMGAEWIERHLTIDVKGDGLDDSSSSEVSDFVKLRAFSIQMNNILGERERQPNQGEILNMQNLGTSLYAKSNLNKDSTTSMSDFEIKAPRVGISSGQYLLHYKDKSLMADVTKGSALLKGHFQKEKVFKRDVLFSFAKENKIGIPVRLHDFKYFSDIVKTGVYEFHLSYGEVLDENLFDSIKLLDSDDIVSLHLPDYLSGNRIIDPISDNEITRYDSRVIINRALEFAKVISSKINKRVPIVGSFSQRSQRNRYEVLDDLFSYIESNSANEFNIFPQWLPVYAWYFGGSVKLELFNSKNDIDYLIKHKKQICLDICHLGLSAKYFDASWKDWYKLLKPLNGHFHFADSLGIDEEGLALGEGNIGDFSIFLDEPVMKIIEVWQGHHNQGLGFMKALETLYKQENKK